MRKIFTHFAAMAVIAGCAVFALASCSSGSESGDDNPDGPVKVTVTLDYAKLQIIEGEQFELHATVSGTDESVVWSSSNSAVAEVAGGVVSAIKEGKATIEATAGTASARCAVAVVAADKAVPITGIALSPAKVVLNTGESKTLTISLLPANATAKEPSELIWESEDTSVASIDDGTITAVGAGKTTVSVCAYGLLEDKNKPLVAECEVEVKASGNDVLKFTDRDLLRYLTQQEQRYEYETEYEEVMQDGFVVVAGAPIDANRDGKITRAEAEKVTCIYGYAIECQQTIDDLLNNFPNLRYYNVGDQGGTSFKADLSEFTKLEALYISNFNFTLPKAGNALRRLGTRHAKSIDLTNCTKLERLKCYDVMEFTSAVDASMCKGLKTVITKNCYALSSLSLPQSVVSLDVSGTALKSLDLAALPNLESLNVANIKNGWNFSSLRKLRVLDCSDTGITSLVVNSDAIEELYVNDNRIGSLAPSKFPRLRVLSCQNCGLTSLDVASSARLTYLSCGANNIGKIDVSKATALQTLECSDCGLSAIDVTKNTALQGLGLAGNKLTSIDLSKNTKLCELELSTNNLGESIDISVCTSLYYFNSRGNSRLKTIYVWRGFSESDGQFYKDSSVAWVAK